MFKNIYIDRDHLLEVMVNSMGDGLIAVDNDGRIYLINPAADYLTGWKSSHVLGKNIAEVSHVVDPTQKSPLELSAILKIFNQRQIFAVHSRFSLIRKDESEIFISETSSPTIDDKGNILGVIFIFRQVDSLEGDC